MNGHVPSTLCVNTDAPSIVVKRVITERGFGWSRICFIGVGVGGIDDYLPISTRCWPPPAEPNDEADR